MPETGEARTVYGVVQMEGVRWRLTEDSTAAPLLNALIFDLQSNPRPEGHKAKDEYGPGLSTVICEKTVPPYEIVYRVDDEKERVVIIAISEARWT
jgi:mRNA-degrading endonuclease RelE of RelBE toxin-antitoxin system